MTGANGMLGREFMQVGAKLGHQMTGWTRKQLDLMRPERGLDGLRQLRPEMVIHCAAETDVDFCERNPELAKKVNAEAPGRLAEVCRENGSEFVFISTSGIFDGRQEEPYSESNVPCPLTAYAKAKLEGEKAAAQAHPQALVLRAGWLFGGSPDMKKNFVAARLREAEGKEEIQSAIDKKGSPTWTRDFAEAALEMAASGKTGVFHLVNSGVASRRDYVVEILAASGKQTRVRGVTSEPFSRSAPVPANESLVSGKVPPLRNWRPALREYVDTLAVQGIEK